MSADLNIEPHGGGCCGIFHLVDFYEFEKGDEGILKALVKRYTDKEDYDGACRLIEAVVTDQQLREYPSLKGALKRIGFRCVSKFKNRGSSNVCRVYHYYNKDYTL